MSWSDVGNWLKENAGAGASLVGSLLVGNYTGAIASGISLVSSATGQSDPEQVLATLQSNPETLVKLKELAYKEEDSIRKHVEEMKRIELEDEQLSHATTQKTIINSDNSSDRLVRWTRPLQSWLSLIMAGLYVYLSKIVDPYILGLLLTLPWSYAGLRQFGKWSDAKHTATVLTQTMKGKS